MKTLTYILVVAALSFSVTYGAGYWNGTLEHRTKYSLQNLMLMAQAKADIAATKLGIVRLFEDIYIQWYEHGEEMKERQRWDQYDLALKEQQRILDVVMPKLSVALMVTEPYYNYEFFIEYYKLQAREI
jgi:hypothetical protein